MAAFACSLPAALASNPGIAAFFDETQLQDIWLTVEPKDWQTLKATYMENTYYHADFQWNDQIVRDIGIRSRGNGSRSGTKPSLKVDFARYDESQRFAGLKSFVLRNMTQDGPMMREHLSMLFLRHMGLFASRTAHARLYVNGEYAGLYLMVEEIDKRYVQDRFPEAGGDLYQYEWAEPYFFGYRGADPKAYCPEPFKPVTNEKKANGVALEALFRTINNASDEEFVAAVSPHLNLKLFLTQLAADNFVTETDGLLSENGVTNFYLYRPAANDRFHFLPWDKNATFLDAEHPIFWGVERTVLSRRAMAVPDLREEYLSALERCANSAGGYGGWLEEKVLATYREIRNAALKDPAKPISNEEFEGEFEVLLHVARSRAESVLRQVQEFRSSAEPR